FGPCDVGGERMAGPPVADRETDHHREDDHCEEDRDRNQEYVERVHVSGDGRCPFGPERDVFRQHDPKKLLSISYACRSRRTLNAMNPPSTTIVRTPPMRTIRITSAPYFPVIGS